LITKINHFCLQLRKYCVKVDFWIYKYVHKMICEMILCQKSKRLTISCSHLFLLMLIYPLKLWRCHGHNSRI
jgi:hypothetical protein